MNFIHLAPSYNNQILVIKKFDCTVSGITIY
ncbi:MAG: hypothetical protein JWM28_3102, partial [Chitinophagaceae bacterium]|nr:hypothetical protein [Chitinophagaceae bacterium]